MDLDQLFNANIFTSGSIEHANQQRDALNHELVLGRSYFKDIIEARRAPLAQRNAPYVQPMVGYAAANPPYKFGFLIRKHGSD